MSSLQSLFFSAREYLAPVLRESKFKEHGRITPEEFVASGDYLVYKFGMWQWSAGDSSKAKDYLPPDKQYLVQRNVPCLKRVSSMAYTDADEDAEAMIQDEDDGGEDWVATHTNRETTLPHAVSMPSMDDIPDVSDAQADLLAAKTTGLSIQEQGDTREDAAPHLDDIPDIEDDDLMNGQGIEEVEDPAAKAAEVAQAQQATNSNLMQLRTYDCLITYDKYYQTPRMWLSGYDEHKKPLPPTLVFQDVSSDYAQKTVTIEAFPNLSNVQMATVHPCKHANVMKKIIDRVNASVVEAQKKEAGLSPSSSVKDAKKKGWGVSAIVSKATGSSGKKEEETASASSEVEGLRVDQYLLIFLKFMSSIVPTIEVDSTASLSGLGRG